MLAGVIVAIFPAGVPLALFVLLFVNREQIKQRETRSGNKQLNYVGES